MAVNFKFTCTDSDTDFLEVSGNNTVNRVVLTGEYKIDIDSGIKTIDLTFLFDIPTAIKFAKTLRTEINKAKEVNNG